MAGLGLTPVRPFLYCIARGYGHLEVTVTRDVSFAGAFTVPYISGSAGQCLLASDSSSFFSNDYQNGESN